MNMSMASRPIANQRKENTEWLLLDLDSDEKIKDIINSLATGNSFNHKTGKWYFSKRDRGLHLYCQENNLDYMMLFNYIKGNPELNSMYENAKRARAERLVDEVIDIADTPAEDMVQAVDKKTRIDTRKWIAQTEYREVYGNKVQVENVNINLIGIYNEAEERLKAIQGEVLGKE